MLTQEQYSSYKSLLIISLTIMLVVMLPAVGSGMGIPKIVYGYIYDSTNGSSANCNVTVYIQTRPEEKVSNTTFRWKENRSMWAVNIGNFPTSWKGGETLVIEVTTPQGETNNTTITLNSDAFQMAPPLTAVEKTWIEKNTMPMVVAAILMAVIIPLYTHIKGRGNRPEQHEG